EFDSLRGGGQSAGRDVPLSRQRKVERAAARTPDCALRCAGLLRRRGMSPCGTSSPGVGTRPLFVCREIRFQRKDAETQRFRKFSPAPWRLCVWALKFPQRSQSLASAVILAGCCFTRQRE